jgi:hypothetical protein
VSVADSETFDFTADHLAEATPVLDRLSARGTVRLALKAAGLDPASVSTRQMLVVLKTVLPGELRRRGVADAEALCSGVAERLAGAGLAAGGPDAADRAAAVFARLGGGG